MQRALSLRLLLVFALLFAQFGGLAHGVTHALLALWRIFEQRLGSLGFYALFALAVIASAQLAGVYLVFASLIVPALATHRMTRRRMPAAFGIGIAGYALGLLASVQADLPAGAAIVWAMALTGSLVLLKQHKYS